MVITYFSTREWIFTNDNVKKLWADISDSDKELFPFNISRVNWDTYHKHQVYGIRQYVLKEDITTVPAAKIKYKRYYNYAWKATVYFRQLFLAADTHQSIAKAFYQQKCLTQEFNTIKFILFSQKFDVCYLL